MMGKRQVAGSVENQMFAEGGVAGIRAVMNRTPGGKQKGGVGVNLSF